MDQETLKTHEQDAAEIRTHLNELAKTISFIAPVIKVAFNSLASWKHAIILCNYKEIDNLYILLKSFIDSHYKWKCSLPHSAYDDRILQLEAEFEDFDADDIIREIDYKNCLVKQALGR